VLFAGAEMKTPNQALQPTAQTACVHVITMKLAT
jgi:hypothetical protein